MKFFRNVVSYRTLRILQLAILLSATALVCTAVARPAAAAAADLFFSDTKIIRDGQIVVMVDDSWCRAINFDNLHRVIPEGESTVMEVISRTLASKRAITAEELAVCNGAPPPVFVFNEEFSFGSTPGRVDYGENNQYAGAGNAYPTAANGVTFGWYGGDRNFANRSTQLPVSLAGIAFVHNNGMQAVFRIDLPTPGTYNINLAIGDAESGRINGYVKIMDSGTVVAEFPDVDTSAGTFVDATGVIRMSPEEWVSSNASITHTFTGSILTVVVGQPVTSAGVSVISHIAVSAK